jgi:hypothetical protein
VDEAYGQGNLKGTNKFAIPNADFRYANRGWVGAIRAAIHGIGRWLPAELSGNNPAINSEKLCAYGIKSGVLNIRE